LIGGEFLRLLGSTSNVCTTTVLRRPVVTAGELAGVLAIFLHAALGLLRQLMTPAFRETTGRALWRAFPISG
jgi:hypothetical protein